MSELQTELNEIGSTLNHWPAVVDAARRVANPDYDAGLKPWYAEHGQDFDPRVRIQKIVDAVLGITEDTDGE